MKLKLLVAATIALFFTAGPMIVLKILGALHPSATIREAGAPIAKTVETAKSPTTTAVAIPSWIDPKTCKQLAIQVPLAEDSTKLILATEDAIQGCNQRRVNDETSRQLQQARDSKKQEEQSRRERRGRFEEIGQYSGTAHKWTINRPPTGASGIDISIDEADVLRDRLLIPIRMSNPENGTRSEIRLRFTLMTEDGDELACEQITKNDGRAQVSEGLVIPPLPGEQATIVLRFIRKNSSGRFALAVNGRALFHLTGYNWTLRPFGASAIPEPLRRSSARTAPPGSEKISFGQ